MRSTINLTVIDWAAIALVVVGALNWGLVGMAHFLTDGSNWNLVNAIFSSYPTVEHTIYLLVGLASLWSIFLASRMAGLVGESEVPGMRPESGK